MFSKSEKAAAYPPVPDSLHSDSLSMEQYRATAAPRADTAPPVTPYLNLRSRLSQIWINRWTVLLLLVLVRIVLLIGSLNTDLAAAKVKAVSACTKVEDIGSAMASMPHYLSVGVNSLAADGISKAVHGLVDGLELVLTGTAALLLFVINMMTSTYVCLITALIHGGLEVAGVVVKDFSDALNKATSSLANNLQSDAKGVQDKINSFASSVLNDIFGKLAPPIPQVDLSGSINSIKNLQIDSSGFVSDINKLNSTIPTFAQVQNMTRQAVNLPFNMVKDLLNSTYGNYRFDKSVFPTAQKQQLTFCSDNNAISDFFDNLFKIVATAKIVFIVLLSLLAILVCVPMAYLEIRRYRKQRRFIKMWESGQYDAMDIQYISSRPLTARFGIKVASRFKGQRQILARWAVAYGTSLPAIFVLSLALAGFFSCLMQFILLQVIQKEVPALASQVGNFANEVVSTLENVSDKWAHDANGVIGSINNDINRDFLGYVTNATSAVNDTLNVFVAGMNGELSAVFNGTVLLNPVLDVMNCLIGLKVASVQSGLTWVHDHAKVNFPLFPNDTFSAGAAASISGDSDLTTFLASPSSVTTDEVTGAVTYVTDAMRHHIVQEALVSTGLLLVYVIVVLIGVIRALLGMASPQKSRGEGGLRTYTGEDRPPLSPRSQERAEFAAASGEAAPTRGAAMTGARGDADEWDFRNEKPRSGPSDGRGQFDAGNKF